MTDRESDPAGHHRLLWDELWETRYVSHRPFVVDASRIESAFGLTATPLDEVLAATLLRANVPPRALTIV